MPEKEQQELEIKHDSAVDGSDPTDSRAQYVWQSAYPSEAQLYIRIEAIYLGILLFLSLAFIAVTWKGLPCDLFEVSGKEAYNLRKYCYYIGSGTLGGAIFSIKYLYRVVARGYWHLDRRLWRILSPLVSLGVAFATGALIDASILASRPPVSSAAIVGTGFLTGYFADQAIAKMYEVAHAFFGTTAKKQ